MARALNESQWLVTIGGYSAPIYFSGKSGGEKKATANPYNDGLNRINKKLIGNMDVSDVVLTRAYDPNVDEQFITFLDDYCNAEDGDLVISIQAVDKCATANPIGAAYSYTGVQLLGYSLPDVNRDGDAVATVTYTFAADDLTVG